MLEKAYEDKLRQSELSSLEKALQRSYSSLPVPKWVNGKDGEGLFTRVHRGIGQKVMASN